MTAILRTFNRSLVCTYSTLKLLCSGTIATNTALRGLYTFKQRHFLSVIYATKFNISLAAMSTGTIKTATYEDVKALENNKSVLLIDVREPSELQQTGVLPGSINIPLGEVEHVLKNTPADDFVKRFGRPKPDSDVPLVFSCLSGKRSANASAIAIKLGYKSVASYEGGWKDWEKHLK